MGLYAKHASSCSLRASSGGVLEMEQGAAPAHRSRTPGPGRPSDPTWAPLRAPRQELADVQVATKSGLDEKRGPRTEIAAVERREARRSWTGDLRRNGDRPDREAGHLGAAAIRTSAVSALRPPRLSRGKYRKPRA